MAIHIDNSTPPAQLFSKLPAGSIRVLQISDTHLFADQSKCLVGMNTEDSFQQLLDLARETILPVDLMLVTGDLVHDATPTGYRRIRDHLLTLNAPAYCIPGNHDLNPAMDDNVQCSTISTDAISTHENWLLIMLDSTIPGRVAGHLDQQQLAHLKSGLEAHPGHHALVCLHHHPVPMGSAWLDGLAIDNPEELFAILDQHSNVRGLVWGHTHQQYDGERNGVQLMGSPSTCIQFLPEQDDFGIAYSPPGLRWMALLPNGEIQTGIERLTVVPEGVHAESVGY